MFEANFVRLQRLYCGDLSELFIRNKSFTHTQRMSPPPPSLPHPYPTPPPGGKKKLLSPTFPNQTWDVTRPKLKPQAILHDLPITTNLFLQFPIRRPKKVRLTKRPLSETLGAISWQFLSFPQTGPHHRHITSPDRLFVLDRLGQEGRSAKFDRKFPPGLAGLFVLFVAGTAG